MKEIRKEINIIDCHRDIEVPMVEEKETEEYKYSYKDLLLAIILTLIGSIACCTFFYLWLFMYI